MTPPRREQGYAMVAAVAAIAVFALAATMFLHGTERRIDAAQAEQAQAQAAAAADGVTQMALAGLLTEDRAFRWSIDGRPRTLSMGKATAEVRIEDERGKVPLGLLDEESAEQLVAVLGLTDERAAVVRDSLLDWIDDDDDPRPDGAESAYYASRGYAPRNGTPQSLDELMLVRGFDGALIDRLRGLGTFNFGSGGFDPHFANPDAIRVMLSRGMETPEVIERRRALAGQRPAIEIGEPVDLIARPMSIVVDARTPDGGHAHRVTIVELTGSQARPYVVRAFD